MDEEINERRLKTRKMQTKSHLGHVKNHLSAPDDKRAQWIL